MIRHFIFLTAISLATHALADLENTYYISTFASIELKDKSKHSGWINIPVNEDSLLLKGEMAGKPWQKPIQFYRKFSVTPPEDFRILSLFDKSKSFELSEKRSDCKKPETATIKIESIKKLDVDFEVLAPQKPECLGSGACIGDSCWSIIVGDKSTPDIQRKVNAADLLAFRCDGDPEIKISHDIKQYPEALQDWAKELLENDTCPSELQESSLKQLEEKIGAWTDSIGDFQKFVPSENLYRSSLVEAIIEECKTKKKKKACKEVQYYVESYLDHIVKNFEESKEALNLFDQSSLLENRKLDRKAIQYHEKSASIRKEIEEQRSASNERYNQCVSAQKLKQYSSPKKPHDDKSNDAKIDSTTVVKLNIAHCNRFKKEAPNTLPKIDKQLHEHYADKKVISETWTSSAYRDLEGFRLVQYWSTNHCPLQKTSPLCSKIEKFLYNFKGLEEYGIDYWPPKDEEASSSSI